MVYRLGWTLLHLLYQAAVIALLLAIVLRLLRKSTASLRYTIACSALALIVLAPAVTFGLISAPAATSPIESAPVAPITVAPVELTETDMPVGRAVEYLDMTAPAPWMQRVKDFFSPALPYIVAGWLLGVFALSLYHLGGWTRLRRLRRKMTKQADEALLLTLENLARKLRVTRRVHLVQSALVQIPTVVGWLRPLILLPTSALTGLTADQLEALLAHELAHIRRCDYLVNILQTVVEILAFYHPGVWWISHRIRAERENCCDDVAVTVCGDRVGYARALAEMESIRSNRPELAIAANAGNLMARIRRLITKSSPPRQRFNWAAALITAAVIAAMAIPTTIALSRSRAADARTAPVVEKVDDDPDQITIEGDILLTIPHKGSDRRQDATLRTSKLTLNLPQVDRPNAKPAIVAEGPASPAFPVQDSQAGQARAQILFDCKIYELPTDSKLLKDAGKGKIIVRSDKTFADALQVSSKEDKQVKVLSAPRIITLEGEEAHISVGSYMPYTEGYTEQPGEAPKPIIKTVFNGMQLKVKAGLIDQTNVRADIIFTWAVYTLSTYNVAGGREIQVPITAKTESSMVVSVPDGGTVLVGGMQSPKDPARTIILRFTPRIVRPGQEPPTDPLPVTPADGKVVFTLTPQVTTSVRLDTHIEDSGVSEDSKPADVVREFVAMLKGRAPTTFELLKVQMAVADQLDDLRKLCVEQSVEIDATFANGAEALVTTKPLTYDRNREGRLLFHLVRKDDRWLIDDIDFESPGGVKDEMARFNDRPLKAEPGQETPPRKGPSEKTAGRFFELKYADPKGIINALVNLLPPDCMQNTKIVSHPNSNRLLVRATDADLRLIENLIAALDYAATRKTPPAREDLITRVFLLKHADCQETAALLGALPMLKQNTTIVADSRLKRLVVQATEADLELITTLIAELDRSESGPVTNKKAEGAEELRSLEDQRKQMADRIKELRRKIRQLQQDISVGDLKRRQDFGLQRAAALLSELTKTESRRMSLETRVKSLKSRSDYQMDPAEMLRMRHDYVNNDATVKALAEKIAQVEMELILARQTSTPDHPEVKRKTDLLKIMRQRLDVLKVQRAEEFDELMAAQAAATHKQKLDAALAELDQTKEYEERLRHELEAQDAEVVQSGRKQLEVQMIQNEMEAMQQEYDDVNVRIRELKVTPRLFDPPPASLKEAEPEERTKPRTITTPQKPQPGQTKSER